VLQKGPRHRAVALCVILAAACANAFGASADGFYVWQRQWSERVAAAVDAELNAGTHDLHVLGGELEYVRDRPQWRASQVPPDLWRHPRVTAVLRLPVRALGDPESSAAAIVARADALGVCRVQLDVDVPERRLDRYAAMLKGVRRLWPPSSGALRLGATFLPCHLGHDAVRRALAEIDEPVIQLHGIDAPKNRAAHWALMDRTTAFRALEAAHALDGRFKMALPSYAYVLTFHADGRFRRLYAEGLSDAHICSEPKPHASSYGSEQNMRIAEPDLGLLHEIFASPLRLPVIWFRLPIPGADRWCLARETLVLLEDGQCPEPHVEFSVREGARPGTLDLLACYRHQIPLHGATVSVDWGVSDGEFFALNECRVEDGAAYGRLPTRLRLAPRACGETFVVGKAITSADPKKISIRELEESK